MTKQLNSSLDGKVALITGGGTGIGKAIALRFATAGAKVILSGRTLDAIQAVARETGGHAISADVSSEADVAALFSEIRKTHGRLDILINSAGMPGPIMPVSEMHVVQWDQCMAVNVRGAMLCMREAARIMTAQKSGSIVNMSSLMGLQGYPMRSAYSATKFALIGMTQAVAREVGPSGVRVNALCPGAVSGELMDRVIERRSAAEGKSAEQIIKENYTDVAALRRWVDPEEVAEAALFLASDASSSITGETIKVDAGRF
jgi:NAD(P)-dependent dehydrogenase (short-subunit alcohol dehydrogenase family)